ncbi:MAG: hypothetical protein QNJ68_21145 [Microcoleaceae cyanobacterium MO_207.B10]|nr:hypothetical protein [Microcoleaceae cyanobacterium MO_207.B10]
MIFEPVVGCSERLIFDSNIGREKNVGWVERSETQHKAQIWIMLGFVASTQPTSSQLLLVKKING